MYPQHLYALSSYRMSGHANYREYETLIPLSKQINVSIVSIPHHPPNIFAQQYYCKILTQQQQQQQQHEQLWSSLSERGKKCCRHSKD